MEETKGSCGQKRKKIKDGTYEDDDSELLSGLELKSLHHQIICPVLRDSSKPCTCYILITEIPYQISKPPFKFFSKRKKTGTHRTHDDNAFLSKEKVTLKLCSGLDILSEASCALNASKLAEVQEDVEGYYVKKEVAPMLRRIYDKHGDIAKDCKIKSRTHIVPILEMICSFCQKLENTSMHSVTMESELEDMMLIAENFQLLGFHVEWLFGRLKDISIAQQCVKVHLALNEKNTKIKMKEKEVEILKHKLSSEEAELAMMKVERDKVNCDYRQKRNVLMVNGFALWHKSMLNGLI